jgi:2,4-dienoyl-CoA reductase-like NADH-dependent reductase (Old Yellow Enzyme family)
LSGVPVIAVGSVGLDAEHQAWRVERNQGYVANPAPASFARLQSFLERDEFDLIAVGRALLADPNWVSKVRRAAFEELKPYSTTIRNIFH